MYIHFRCYADVHSFYCFTALSFVSVLYFYLAAAHSFNVFLLYFHFLYYAAVQAFPFFIAAAHHFPYFAVVHLFSLFSTVN